MWCESGDEDKGRLYGPQVCQKEKQQGAYKIIGGQKSGEAFRYTAMVAVSKRILKRKRGWRRKRRLTILLSGSAQLGVWNYSLIMNVVYFD